MRHAVPVVPKVIECLLLLIGQDERLGADESSHPFFILADFDDTPKRMQLTVLFGDHPVATGMLVGAFSRANGESVNRAVQRDEYPLPRVRIVAQLYQRADGHFQIVNGIPLIIHRQTAFPQQDFAIPRVFRRLHLFPLGLDVGEPSTVPAAQRQTFAAHADDLQFAARDQPAHAAVQGEVGGDVDGSHGGSSLGGENKTPGIIAQVSESPDGSLAGVDRSGRGFNPRPAGVDPFRRKGLSKKPLGGRVVGVARQRDSRQAKPAATTPTRRRRARRVLSPQT